MPAISALHWRRALTSFIVKLVNKYNTNRFLLVSSRKYQALGQNNALASLGVIIWPRAWYFQGKTAKAVSIIIRIYRFTQRGLTIPRNTKLNIWKHSCNRRSAKKTPEMINRAENLTATEYFSDFFIHQVWSFSGKIDPDAHLQKVWVDFQYKSDDSIKY